MRSPRRTSASNGRVPTTSSLINYNLIYCLSCQILLLAFIIGHQLQHSAEASNASREEPANIRSAPATGDNNNNNNNNNSSELLLSGEEFVDSKEAPLILFDGTSDEDEPSMTTNRAPSESDHDARSKHEEPQLLNTTSNNTTSSQAESPGPRVDSSAAVDKQVTAAPKSSNNDTRTNLPNESSSSLPEGEEEAEELQDDNQDQTSGFPAAANTPFEPPQNISQYMDYIEKLFHDLRHQIAHLFEPHLPQLIRTSQMVELSSFCSYDMLRMALALRQFEPWALRMIDSSGKVPEGIFEGSFTALGSYDECLNTVFQSGSGSTSASSAHNHQAEAATSTQDSATSKEQQKSMSAPTQGKYCLVSVSPFMPPKPPADKVDRLFQEEANRRNYTRDDQFSRLSPMFYYMKFRIGVCIPSTCDQDDMQSISSALSSSLRLNITIPDCRVKHADEPLTRHQLLGGLTFALALVCVLVATLVDCFSLKWRQLEHKDLELQVEVVQKRCVVSRNQIKIKLAPPDSANLKMLQEALREPDLCRLANANATKDSCASDCNAGGRIDFVGRLRKHWSWLSFSALTNFRLYFQTQHASSTATAEALEGEDGQIGHKEDRSMREREVSPNTTTNQQMITCLNGIRVLSLCWVIVANSYLTLDPRATKRLTKTREAPRDFLFQLVVQASLAIETFFFLSGLLMSLSFSRRLRPSTGAETRPMSSKEETTTTTTTNNNNNNDNNMHYLLKWVHFYVHRYVRMTPPTMLVIAFSMYAYHYGDGPLWFEATQKVHQSCTQNWWRHLLHVANFIDTRQMCFIHYWYIAADMQLFLFAPVIMFFLHKSHQLGYCLIACVGSLSVSLVFYTTYERNLPPTLLFYSTDPESRREFGNTVMTKPMTHALPYLVGMLVGWWCTMTNEVGEKEQDCSPRNKGAGNMGGLNGRSSDSFGLDGGGGGGGKSDKSRPLVDLTRGGRFSLTGIFGSLALVIALVELFLPYKWNNSHLPSRLMASLYAALFRFGWSLVLAYVVVSCRHRPGRMCGRSASFTAEERSESKDRTQRSSGRNCYCGTGGSYVNRFLSLSVFTHLSRLSFVAYLIHLPLMSVFIGQTRGLFAFSHTLVIHFAISYLVMSFVLSFLLAHVIEFPFITFERLLFDRLYDYLRKRKISELQQHQPGQASLKPIRYEHRLSMPRWEEPGRTGDKSAASSQYPVGPSKLHQRMKTTGGVGGSLAQTYNNVTTERL